jgi:hypothetical protein
MNSRTRSRQSAGRTARRTARRSSIRATIRSDSYSGKRKSKIQKIMQKMISFVKAYCFSRGIDYHAHYPSPELLIHVEEAAQRMMDDYSYTQWSDVRAHFDENVLQYMHPITSFIDYEHSMGDFDDPYGHF